MQAVGLVATVGKEEDEDALVGLADAPGYFETIKEGHVDVEQHQVGLDEGELFEGYRAVSGVGHFVAFFLEKAFQKHGVLEVVVGEEYL